MADNETSVSGDVVYQDGDDLSETNLTRSAAKSNLTDYVERGLGFAVDFAADTLDIGSGHVIIQDGINAYDLFPNQQTDISLPNGGGVNYVFVAFQPGTDDEVYYHIDDDDTPPADPSIKIGTVDTSNDTSDDTVNRNPAGDFRTVDINGATVLEADGMVATSAIPDLAITETYVVADKSDRLSLDAEEGDIAIQQDVDESYIFTGGDPSNDDDWSEIVTSPATHSASHEKGGSDELTTFGDTNHDSVNTDVLFTPPQRTVLSKDTNQTLSNGSLEEITWESSPVDRQGIADLSNNGVTVPSNPDFDELKLRCKLRLSGDTGGILIFNRVNGNNPNSTDDARLQGDYSTGAENELNLPIVESPWIDANGGDTWTFKCRQNSGGYIDISSSSTLLEVFVQ